MTDHSLNRVADESDIVVLAPGLTYDQARFLNDCGRQRPYRALNKATRAIADQLVELGLLERKEHVSPGTFEDGRVISKPRQQINLIVSPFGVRVAREYAKRGYYGKRLAQLPSSAARTRVDRKEWGKRSS